LKINLLDVYCFQNKESSMRVFSKYSGSLLKQKRKQLGLSQRAVNDAMGLGCKNGQYYYNIETGKAPFPPKYINRISLILHVSRSDLLEAVVQDFREALIAEISKD
jgi:transcriptional regulator with XRE-family HTH domain